MSGINELKEKSKKQLQMNEKRKMGLGEMFEDQSVGKLESQKDGKEESKQTTQPDIQQTINPISQLLKKPEIQTPNQHPQQESTFSPNQLSDQTANQPYGKMDIQAPRHTPAFSTKQPQSQQKAPVYKMTFNLSEEIYKAFNDLYAHRMLKGRKTEKSEMICEAIQWLIKMEEERTN